MPAGSTVFTISDSPTFYNITALFITVDNVSIHSATTGKWYSIPVQTSTFNLIDLRNISSILSGVMLENGTYNELVFHVSKVEATANGTNQSVFLPTNSIKIFGDFNISNNGTTNWINIDFDLEHSLHITQNGSIIMLPILHIIHVYGSALQLNQSSIIISSYPGRTRTFYEFGMDTNGIMTRNYTTPQNWSIWQYKGRLEVNGTGVVPIIMGRRHGFIIGGSANGFLQQYRYNSTLNETNANYTNHGNFSSWHNRNISITGWYNGTSPDQPGNWTDLNVTVKEEHGFHAHCILQNGALSCDANRSIIPADIWGNINAK